MVASRFLLQVILRNITEVYVEFIDREDEGVTLEHGRHHRFPQGFEDFILGLCSRGCSQMVFVQLLEMALVLEVALNLARAVEH